MKKNDLNSAGLDTASWMVGAPQAGSCIADSIIVDPGDPYPLAGTTTSAGTTVGAAKPVGTIPQLANFLVNTFWQDFGEIAHHWGSSTVSFNVNVLNAAEQFLALNALQAWHEVANLTFVQTTGSANITFTDAGTMTAFTNANWNGSGVMSSATVDISSDWITSDGGAYDGKTGIDSYGYQTYVHEIGHALGLGHQGPYNGSATYSTDAIFANDTWQYSIMSYFSEDNYSGSSYRYVVTPQMADIYAVGSIYGAATGTRPGDTVYGFNCTAGNIYDFTKYSTAPALTIYDSGGNNTLDCSGYSAAQTIDLHPGAYSSVGGLVHNIGIALNTTIQKAIAGFGNDTLIANDSGCTLVGGAGNDAMIGGAGNDTMIAGTGVDTMTGGGGADNFVFAQGESSAAHPDLITDFVSGDHIDLSAIDAISSTPTHDPFYFYGIAAFNHTAGELNYYYNSSLNVTVLQGDTNGDNTADFAIDLTGNVTLSLSNLIGAIAAPSITIESFGSTSLVQTGNNYFLNPTAGGAGPLLKSGGVAIYIGQCGSYVPIGAEQVASGYDVVWKNGSADQYVVWATDSNGNYASSLTGVVSGTSATLESYEPILHQDLNGDGTIGLVATVIESFGVTSLAQMGSNYYLNPTAGGAGPSLKSGGVAIYAGQCGSYVPIGAEQTASGYDVVWKNGSADQYVVWATDSNGNYASSLTGVVSGTSATLESYEPILHQDLNGDGTIGPVATVIESFGVTSLVQLGSNYYLNPVAGGTGPTVKSGGVAITVGQCGSYVPIGAEQTASGYDVVWKNGSADQYVVWGTDSNGNYVSSLTGVVSGTSTTLESYEPILHQDLNGDGVIGVPPAMSSLSPANDSFVFRSAPLVSPLLANAGGAGLVHSASSLDPGQGSLSTPVVQHLAGLVGSIETVDASHTNFHSIDPLDHHFMIR